MIKSIFRYPGGKSKGVNHILSCAPKLYCEYREPFVGGGSIFFNIPTDKKRWINDINSSLVSVYADLRDRPDKFIRDCRSIKEQQSGEEKVYPTDNSCGKKYNARLKKIFDYFVHSQKEREQSLRYFFINRTVWGGRVNYNPKMRSRMYFSNPEGWNIIKTNRLEKASRILQNTKITNYSYEKILNDPGDNVWIYCDPPYMKNTKLSQMSQLYEHGFTKEDHLKFVDKVKKSTHRICISYDDVLEIRKLFTKEEGFFVHSVEWRYCGTSSADGQSKKKKVGKELIITNYKITRKNTQYLFP